MSVEHSLKAIGGFDIAGAKRLYGHQICLIGNLECALLHTGTAEQIVEGARYGLKHGMPGDGYIFSTRNCIHPGIKPSRYEMMLEVWRSGGNY
jgi:uroporphyrinogen decarboxylase